MHPLAALLGGSVALWIVRTILRGDEMFDCGKEVRSYYNDEVALPQDVRDQMRAHRDSNRERLHSRLKQAGKPLPLDHVIQGSYAMWTMIQHEENDFDIDDGVVFAYEDLKGPRGGDMTPREAKEMVCEVLQDKRFERQPDIRTNCVRVYYQGGYHVDVPVYRKMVDEDWGKQWLELAGTEWRKSDARAVTQWFKNAVATQSPEAESDQMRVLVQLVKDFATSRASWNAPSGLIISVLVSECYHPCAGRLDEAFYRTIRAIRDQLFYSLAVRHPVLDENITKSDEDACMRDFLAHLNDAVSWLEPLQDEAICPRKTALAAWDNVFNTDYFSTRDGGGGKALAGGFTFGSSSPSAAADKGKGGDRWA